jgi:hypothetical protein
MVGEGALENNKKFPKIFRDEIIIFSINSETVNFYVFFKIYTKCIWKIS